jgi:hypothetical protein
MIKLQEEREKENQVFFSKLNLAINHEKKQITL